MIDSHTHLDFCDPPNGELVDEALAVMDRLPGQARTERAAVALRGIEQP